MLAGWVMFGVLGNEIRFADEIPAVGGDEIRPYGADGGGAITELRITRYEVKEVRAQRSCAGFRRRAPGGGADRAADEAC